MVVQDIPADPNRQDVFTYYSLRDSAIVSLADSNSTKWDLAFKSTTVLTNSGSSGPGQGGAIALIATDYDTLSTAPGSGYVQDQAGLPAIGRAWYTYTGPEGFPPHAILMNPGVRTRYPHRRWTPMPSSNLRAITKAVAQYHLLIRKRVFTISLTRFNPTGRALFGD